MLLEYFIERDRWEGQTRENAARQAFSWGTFDSTGFGELPYPEQLDFGVTFIHEPYVSYGFSVEQAAALDELPTSAGGVFKWRQDGRGFYVGAHVYVVVDSFSHTYAVDPRLVHHFSFTGIAIKDIGADQFRDE